MVYMRVIDNAFTVTCSTGHDVLELHNILVQVQLATSKAKLGT